MQRIDSDTEVETAPGRALVAVTPVDADMRHVPTHPSAAFVTQLLAIKAGLPQTRERRRAEPDEASRQYVTAMSPRPRHTGRVLSRAM